MRSLQVTLLCGFTLFAMACSKETSVLSARGVGSRGGSPPASSREIDVPSLLTREEVGTVIGVPVLELESNSKSRVTYKTANPMLEARIEVERKQSEEDAIQAIAAIRVAAKKTLGAGFVTVIGLGDEALFGERNVLHVRKGDLILTVAPPDLARAVGKRTAAVRKQPPGSASPTKAVDISTETMDSFPSSRSMMLPDAASGASERVTRPASPATDIETEAREMARTLAEMVLAKIAA